MSGGKGAKARRLALRSFDPEVRARRAEHEARVAASIKAQEDALAAEAAKRAAINVVHVAALRSQVDRRAGGE